MEVVEVGGVPYLLWAREVRYLVALEILSKSHFWNLTLKVEPLRSGDEGGRKNWNTCM